MCKISREEKYSLIKKLAEIRAPSGLEGARAEMFMDEVRKYVDPAKITTDRLGNVIIHIEPATKENSGSQAQAQTPKIALIGHLDEIGATVYKIKKNGKILIQKRGGYESRWLVSRKVEILTLNGTWITGVILGRTTHSIPQAARKKPFPEVNQLEIFVGAETAEKVESMGIHVGSPVVFGKITEYLNRDSVDDVVMSNSLDNVVSLVVLLEIAARLSEKSCINAEIYLVATAREEIGMEGSRFFGMNHRPDKAVAIDFAVVESDLSALDNGGSFRGGPFIVWSEASGRDIFDYDTSKSFIEVANKHGLEYQNGVFEYYGSDSGILQKQLGIPSALIAFPMLSGHNVPEIVALEEVEKVEDLLWFWLRDNYCSD